jgi:hypothetical protein
MILCIPFLKKVVARVTRVLQNVVERKDEYLPWVDNIHFPMCKYYMVSFEFAELITQTVIEGKVFT